MIQRRSRGRVIAVARNLKRLEYYPNAPLATLIRVAEHGDRDAYDLMFSYHHSTTAQLGQVNVSDPRKLITDPTST